MIKKIKKHLKGFSIAELYVVLIVLGVITLITLGITFNIRNNESQFEAKFNKIESMITSNIERDINTHTGRRFATYTENNEIFVNAVLNNVNYDESTQINDFWSDKTSFDIANPIQNGWTFAKLTDGTVLAIDDDSTTIWIDINGKKKPNEINKDIRKYSSPLENQTSMRTSSQSFSVCQNIGAAPNSDTFTYEFNYADCRWEINGCINPNKVPSGDTCVCNNSNPASDDNLALYNYTRNGNDCTWRISSCKNGKTVESVCTSCPACPNQYPYQNSTTCECFNKLITQKEKTTNSFYASIVAFTNGNWGSLNYTGNVDKYTTLNGKVLEIYTDYQQNNPTDFRAVVGGNWYFCAPVNGGTHLECHINGGQVPDIQYDKQGNVTAVVCNKFSGQLGDCTTAKVGCTTAICNWDNINKTWFTDASEDDKYLFHAIRCRWVELNGNHLEGCENFPLP